MGPFARKRIALLSVSPLKQDLWQLPTRMGGWIVLVKAL